MRSWADYKKTMREEDPLFALARSGNLAAFSRLDLTPERIDSRDARGYSPLMLAAYHGHAEVVRFLLERGADPESPDPSGSTVLMGAAFKGELEIVRSLIAAGANPEARNRKNQTALDFANLFGRSKVARFLKSKRDESADFGWKDILSGWSSFLFPKGETKHG